MALIISSTQDKQLKLKGTAIEIPSIYARINWIAPIHGKSIQYSIIPFLDKVFYTNNEPCYVNIEDPSSFIVLGDGSQQNLEYVHEKAQEHFESLGYSVTIDL